MEVTFKHEPVAKGRPKFAVINGNSWSYTPTKTAIAQEEIRQILSKILGSFSAHISLKLTAVFYRTQSKWKPTSREKLPFRKPDLDNFLKLLLDALCMRVIKSRKWVKGSWKTEVEELTPIIPDDAQFTCFITKKRWSTKNYGYITLKIEEDTVE